MWLSLTVTVVLIVASAAEAADTAKGEDQYRLGLRLLNGTPGLPADSAAAYRAFASAATDGNLDAAVFVGIRHARGIGTKVDLDEALFWLTPPAEAGDATAIQELVNIYGTVRRVLHGNARIGSASVPEPLDGAQAEAWQKRLKEVTASKPGGAAHPAVAHGWTETDPKAGLGSAAFQALLRRAEDGDAEAQFHVGLACQLLPSPDRPFRYPVDNPSDPRPPNPPDSRSLNDRLTSLPREKRREFMAELRREQMQFRELITRWNARNLRVLDTPHGEARKWYERAYRNGHRSAGLHLAAMLLNNQGGSKGAPDRLGEVAPLCRAAGSGSPDHALLLAEAGLKDPVASAVSRPTVRDVLRRLTDAGDVVAAARLGTELAAGERLNRDLPGAARCLRIASRAGRGYASRLLRTFAGRLAEETPPPETSPRPAGSTAGKLSLALVSAAGVPGEITALLGAHLSAVPEVVLLERDAIAQILREQQLDAARGRDLLQLGRLLGARGLVFVDHRKDGNKEHLNLRLVATESGVVLQHQQVALPLKEMGEWTELTAMRLARALPKLGVKRDAAVPIAIIGISTPLVSAAATTLERQIQIALTEQLFRVPEIFVLERTRLSDVAMERELDGGGTGFWNGAYLLDGQFNRDGGSLDELRLDLSLTPPGKDPVVIRVTGVRERIPTLIQKAVARVTEVVAGTPAAVSWSPLTESVRYLQEAEWALRWDYFDTALTAAEAAAALGNDSPVLARAALRAAEGLLRPAPDSLVRSALPTSDFKSGREPDSRQIELARRSLDLLCRRIRDPYLSGDYTYLEFAFRLLVDSSALLRHYAHTVEPRERFATELADLRDLCRRTAAELTTNPLVPGFEFRHEPPAAPGLPPILTLAGLKIRFARYWQDTPDANLDWLEETLVRTNGPLKLLVSVLQERPLLVAWNRRQEEERAKIRQELEDRWSKSTNAMLRLEAVMQQVQQLPDEARSQREALRDRFFATAWELRDELLRGSVPAAYWETTLARWRGFYRLDPPSSGIDKFLGRLASEQAESAKRKVLSKQSAIPAVAKNVSPPVYAETNGPAVPAPAFWTIPVHQAPARFGKPTTWRHDELRFSGHTWWFVGALKEWPAPADSLPRPALVEVDADTLATRFHELPPPVARGRTNHSANHPSLEIAANSHGIACREGTQLYVKSRREDSAWSRGERVSDQTRLWSVVDEVVATDSSMIRSLGPDGTSWRILASTRRRPPENDLDLRPMLNITAAATVAGAGLFGDFNNVVFRYEPGGAKWSVHEAETARALHHAGDMIFVSAPGFCRLWDDSTRSFTNLLFDPAHFNLNAVEGLATPFTPVGGSVAVKFSGRLTVSVGRQAIKITDGPLTCEIVDVSRNTRVRRPVKLEVPPDIEALAHIGGITHGGLVPELIPVPHGLYVTLRRVGGFWFIPAADLGVVGARTSKDFATRLADIRKATDSLVSGRVIDAAALARRWQDTPAAVLLSLAETNAEAQFHLGRRMLDRRGGTYQPEQAFQLMQRAADNGIANAFYELAVLWRDGKGVNSDELEALKWARHAASNGVPAGLTLEGDMIASHLLTGPRSRSIEVWRQAAELGETQALQRMLDICLYDDGEDPDKAFDHLRSLLAADRGAALKKLGEIGKTGLWLRDDYAGIRKWMEIGATNGLAYCQYLLATLLEDGIDGPRDLQRATALYQQAWQGGARLACRRLGRLFETGSPDDPEGRPDFSAAMKWYQAGATNQDSFAGIQLGRLLLAQAPDHRTNALAWLSHGVRQGSPEALRLLQKADPQLARKVLAAIPRPLVDVYAFAGHWEGELPYFGKVSIAVDRAPSGHWVLHYSWYDPNLGRMRRDVRPAEVREPLVQFRVISVFMPPDGGDDLVAFHGNGLLARLKREATDDTSALPLARRFAGVWTGEWRDSQGGAWPTRFTFRPAPQPLKPGNGCHLTGIHEWKDRPADAAYRSESFTAMIWPHSLAIIGEFRTAQQSFSLHPDPENPAALIVRGFHKQPQTINGQRVTGDFEYSLRRRATGPVGQRSEAR